MLAHPTNFTINDDIAIITELAKDRSRGYRDLPPGRFVDPDTGLAYFGDPSIGRLGTWSVGSSPSSSSSSSSSSPPYVLPSAKYEHLYNVLNDKLFGNSLSGSSSGVTGNDSTSSNPMISNELDVNKGAYSEYLQDFIDAWNEANTVSKENWQLAADWNEELYNSRYQRTVEDLKRAGVNPLLISSALSSQYSPTVGSPSSISPSLPSVPYSTTGSSEISGLFNLYSTLIKADTDTQIAIMQDLTNRKSISKNEVDMWIDGLGGVLESIISIFNFSSVKKVK